jgi:hypothetical protein
MYEPRYNQRPSGVFSCPLSVCALVQSTAFAQAGRSIPQPTPSPTPGTASKAPENVSAAITIHTKSFSRQLLTQILISKVLLSGSTKQASRVTSSSPLYIVGNPSLHLPGVSILFPSRFSSLMKPSTNTPGLKQRVKPWLRLTVLRPSSMKVRAKDVARPALAQNVLNSRTRLKTRSTRLHMRAS